MTDIDSRLELDDELALLDDPVLIDLVRAGNHDAYGVLYDRYRHAANRLARYLSNAVDAKDIAAESFVQVFDQLRQGRGPDSSFRGYLFTSIRREAGRRAKAAKRVTPTDDTARIDQAVPFGGGGADGFEREIVRSAYESLPKRWRTVLWHLDVEGRKPHEIAAALGLKPNTVSALAYRAREGLRRAYLEQHLIVPLELSGTECDDIRPQIAGLIRGSAPPRERPRIESHLKSCATCEGAFLELTEVNARLGSVTALAGYGAASGSLGGLLAKATVAAKAALATVGSAAAVVATSAVVMGMPPWPASAGEVHQSPVQMSPEQEPDRTIGPAAVPTAHTPRASGESADSSSDGVTLAVASAAPDLPQGTPSSEPPASSPAEQQGPLVSVSREERVVSVDLGDVEGLLNLRKPTESAIKLPDVKVVTKVTGPLDLDGDESAED